MTRKKLREIVCALQSMPSDIAGGLFAWTTASQELFALIKSGRKLDDADRMALGRSLEIAEGIARVLHADDLATRFNDYHAALSKDIECAALEFLGFIRESTLSERRRAQETAEQYYLRLAREEDE